MMPVFAARRMERGPRPPGLRRTPRTRTTSSSSGERRSRSAAPPRIACSCPDSAQSTRSSPSPSSRSGCSSAGASATSSRRSLANREGAEVWSFYEGPPTANGRPGSHHVLSRVFKDVYPRYKTMCGYRVPRKAGWDCHGLPVELEVEKQLGISSKQEIEEFGIAEFNRALPRVGLRVRRGVEPADRADRLLDRPRRPLRHPRRRLHRVGLVVAAQALGRRAASTRATRSSPTARAAAPRSPRTRSRRATRTSRTPRSTCASRCSARTASETASRCWSGRRPRGPCPATSPSRSRPRSPTSGRGSATRR